MKTRHHHQKGISLIVAVSVMMVLSIMAVTFVRMATYDQAASDNYRSYIEAKLAAFAGLDRVVAEIYGQIMQRGYVDWDGRESNWDSDKDMNGNPIANNPVLNYPSASNYDVEEASKARETLSCHEGMVHYSVGPPAKGFSYSGTVGYLKSGLIYGRYEANGNFYALKVVPPASRLNVNGHISSIGADVTDPTKADSIQKDSNRVLNRILKSLAENHSIVNAQALADAIRPVDYKPSTLESRRYHNMDALRKDLSDKGYDLTSSSMKAFLFDLCTDSWIDPSTSKSYKNVDSPKYSALYIKERRAPVNINYVSFALLKALIQNIRATVVFYNNQASYEKEDVSTNYSYQTETVIQNTPTRHNIRFDSLPSAQLNALVNHLRTSKTSGQATRYNNMQAFEDRIQGYGTNFPNKPGNVIQELWDQAWLDALKSNFNPNALDNHWNPNKAINRIACKSNLYTRYNDAGALLTTLPFPAYHTTEICFYDMGDVEIQSMGRVTAKMGELVGGCLLSTRVKFATQIKHTTQEDFSASLATTSGTLTPVIDNYNPSSGACAVSYPAVAGRSGYPDVYAGGIELRPNRGQSVSNPYRPNFTNSNYFPTPSSPPTYPKPVSRMESNSLRSETINNLVHDGIVSRRLHGALPSETKVYVEKALGDNQNLRSSVSNKVGNYVGTVEFWVKLSERQFPGVPSGLIGITTKSQSRSNPSQPATSKVATNPYYEGTQIYAYINTQGKLRISRLYYLTFWDTSVSKWRGPYIDHDAEDFEGTIAHYGDNKRKIPRRDAEIDLNSSTYKWKPNEWHHIRFTWDDEKNPGAGGLKVWIDQKAVSSSDIHEIDNGVNGDFCVLNESNPHDCFLINGFFRDQPKKGGYFHFESDISTKIYYTGNCTLGAMVSIPSYDQGVTFAGRYPTGTINYTHYFKIDQDHDFVPGPIRWIAYQPPSSELAAGTGNLISVSASLCNMDGTALFSTPSEDPYYSASNISSTITPSASYKSLKKGYFVKYTTSLRAARLLSTSSLTNNVSPSLEEISLTLLHAYPNFTELVYK